MRVDKRPERGRQNLRVLALARLLLRRLPREPHPAAMASAMPAHLFGEVEKYQTEREPASLPDLQVLRHASARMGRLWGVSGEKEFGELGAVTVFENPTTYLSFDLGSRGPFA